MTLKMLTAADKVAEIRRLYFETTRETIQADLEKAVDLLKTMSSDDERDRVAVFIDGMVQMRAEWGKGGRKRKRDGKAKASPGGNRAATGVTSGRKRR